MLVSRTAITDPSRRKGPDPERGTRSTYCSPTADMLRTAACTSAGIFGEVSSCNVAFAPGVAGPTAVTLPIPSNVGTGMHWKNMNAIATTEPAQKGQLNPDKPRQQHQPPSRRRVGAVLSPSFCNPPSRAIN